MWLALYRGGYETFDLCKPSGGCGVGGRGVGGRGVGGCGVGGCDGRGVGGRGVDGRDVDLSSFFKLTTLCPSGKLFM